LSACLHSRSTVEGVGTSVSNASKAVVGIIDYKTGNSRSVERALNFLGIPNRMLKSPADLADADRLVLPGVGAAGTTMDYLRAAGWPVVLDELVAVGDMPFLGICVGLQVLFEYSTEQDAHCLGWLPGTVRAFDRAHVRVPQMGWNQVSPQSAHPFTAKMPEDGYFYFVNSFYALPGDVADVAAKTVYGTEFASVVARRNIMATQFHAEKSGRPGLELLRRFATLTRGELCSPRD
jgi:imidazole glycerol-phosphate synthase subunit HisH